MDYTKFLETIGVIICGNLHDLKYIYDVLKDVDDDVANKFFDELDYVIFNNKDEDSGIYPISILNEIIIKKVINGLREAIDKNNKKMVSEFADLEDDLIVYGMDFDVLEYLKEFVEKYNLLENHNLKYKKTIQWLVNSI